MTRADASPLDGGDTTTTDDPVIPSWIYSPRAFFATVVVGWVFDLWGAVLGYISSMWSLMAAIPDVAIYQPITGAFAPAGNAVQNLWLTFGDIAMTVSEAAGPFAPLVAVGFWIIPAMLGVGTVYVLVGFLGTYLPIRSIPGLRRLA